MHPRHPEAAPVTSTWVYPTKIAPYDIMNSLGSSDVACRGENACVMLHFNIRRAQPTVGSKHRSFKLNSQFSLSDESFVALVYDRLGYQTAIVSLPGAK